jgi:triacylglycerol lipase
LEPNGFHGPALSSADQGEFHPVDPSLSRKLCKERRGTLLWISAATASTLGYGEAIALMARYLLWALAAELAGLALGATGLRQIGLVGTASAIAVALCVAFLVHSFFAIGGFVLARGRWVTAELRARPPWRRVALAVLREWVCFHALFVLIQPFAGLWMGADAVGRRKAGQIPVLLVHGYLCNRGAWWWMRRRLEASGLAVATIDLEPPFASIDRFADRLHRRIEALLQEAGARQVSLVCHSMGGLAARAYLDRHGPRRVARLVTLATPHHGTRIARMAPGRNASEMQPGSTWLAALNPPPSGLPMLAMWSPVDNFVAPQESGRLAGAAENVLPGLGHLSVLFSPQVCDILKRELAPIAATAAAQS